GCALAVQRSMAERNAEIAADRLIALRIGIHLGDVVVDGADLLGDGVNIAARLEGIADPGGISLSEDVWRQVRDKLPEAFVDLGEQMLKNIARPMRVYRIDLAGAAEDVFHTQKKTPESIVGTIDPSFRRAEIGRPRPKPQENLGPYALYPRALPHTQSVMPEAPPPAIGYLEEALELAPTYAVP